MSTESNALITRSPIRSLWRLRSYVRPYLGQFIVMVGAGLLAVAVGIVVPLVIKNVIDGPVQHLQSADLLQLTLLVVALGTVESSLILIRRWIQTTSTLGMETAIRDDLYAHLQALPPSFHDQWLTGQLLSRAISDLSAIRRFIGFGLVFSIVNTATFVAIVSVLIHLDPLLGIVVAASLIPIGAVCARFERHYAGISRLVQDQQGDLATVVEEAATGIRVIKAFGRRDLIAARYYRDARTVHATQMSKVRLRAKFISLLDLIPNITLVLILLIGVLAVGSGRLTLGGLVAFITLTLQLVWPVEAMGFILAAAQEAGTAAQRVYEMLDTPPEITDPKDSDPTVGGTRIGDREGQSAQRGRLQFIDVRFSYPGAERPTLHGVNLDIAPGETVALVGASGSGKTTLAMLVPRLADVTGGRILLDGRDLRSYSLLALRTAVATAFEEPILFSASVHENVTLGRPDAGAGEVEAALELAQATFAYDLPWGLDTRVGEQGMSLSGGQRQRIALARAVIGRPEVLVLDDPLSALDVETEALVEEALRRVLAQTTALIVVHRPSTVALADRVALLAGGTVRAVGTHNTLLATVPEYAALLGRDDSDLTRGVFR